MRHFARKGLFDVLPILKGENEPFPLPFPPCNVVPLFELPVENNKYLNFEWRGRGGVWILLFSEVTLFEYNVSTSLSPIKVLFHVSFVINIVTFEYPTRVFFSFFVSPNFFIKR